LLHIFPALTMPQYLRVRRRRNAQTSTMLQLEGLMEGRKRNRDVSEQMEALADLNLQQHGDAPTPDSSATATSNKKHRTAVWRRVDWSPATHKDKKKKCRVIDAVLEDETQEEEEVSEHATTKRRRLTLVTTNFATVSSVLKLSSSVGKIPGGVGGYKILHPLERLVDDSLQFVAGGSKTSAQHWELCRNDPSFIDDRFKWYSWCNAEVGNILHACALWNDPETASNVLKQRGVDVETITQAVNGENLTPYQVAQLLSHEQVCQVLEVFGGDSTYDSGFVIDVYCLDEDNTIHDDDITTHHRNTNNDDDPVTCELLGGVGYWDERGELVLELPQSNSNGGVDEALYTNDDDADSNSEGWEGNDYPDVEEDDYELYDDKDDDDGDDAQPDVSFRNRAFQLP
jgi:hypothetical protein